MTDQNSEQEARRTARRDGWASEHFRLREDMAGNLYVARAEFIGPEALTFNLAFLPELLDELNSVLEDVPASEPADEPTQPTPPVAVVTDTTITSDGSSTEPGPTPQTEQPPAPVEGEVAPAAQPDAPAEPLLGGGTGTPEQNLEP